MNKLCRIGIAVFLTLLIAIGLSFSSRTAEPYELGYVQGGHIEPWTLERGIEYLEWAKGNHQFYLDNPNRTNESTGDVDFNRKCVSEYEQIIRLLENIKE